MLDFHAGFEFGNSIHSLLGPLMSIAWYGAGFLLIRYFGLKIFASRKRVSKIQTGLGSLLLAFILIVYFPSFVRNYIFGLGISTVLANHKGSQFEVIFNDGRKTADQRSADVDFGNIIPTAAGEANGAPCLMMSRPKSKIEVIVCKGGENMSTIDSWILGRVKAGRSTPKTFIKNGSEFSVIWTDITVKYER